MPSSSTGHTGIRIDGGSTIAVADVQITGGAVGIYNTNQQVIFKNIYFKFCTTAYVAPGGFNSLLQGVTFDTCGVGIDSTKDHGQVILLDSESKNSGNTVVFRDSSNDSGNRNSQVVIQNLKHDNDNPIAVLSTGQIVLTARATVDTWVWGNAVPGQYVKGNTYPNTRAQALLDGSAERKFFMKDAPTYAGYAKDQIVNVKAAGFDVKGDGKTDDSAALNAILAQNAANCKITYVPLTTLRRANVLTFRIGTSLTVSMSSLTHCSFPQGLASWVKPGPSSAVQVRSSRTRIIPSL